jgi:diaminopimelate epimerase
MDLIFTKLEGNGNDFILIDEYAGMVIPDEMKGHFAALYCDRHCGIGGDGVLFLGRGEDESGADLTMRLFQPDESEAEMCGNGIRCLVMYAYDRGYVTQDCVVKTIPGLIPVSVRFDSEGIFLADVTMPPAIFERAGIPALGTGEYHELIGGYDVYAVNTGVPHAVVFVGDIMGLDISRVAPHIRMHPSFPEGANVNFASPNGESSFAVRTFERGVEAETLSCGTGSAAVAAVARHLEKAGDIVHIETAGGPLVITITDVIRMEGPAEIVFEGFIKV